ncbi:uncharacterized protein LOC141904215 [Tubulanus polymorphus]|uniref:uncharacterized protein LOC141904215 n=1 Tax=Tubulanus polymorphus TaxID=672921 RepID=UPI003DA45A01
MQKIMYDFASDDIRKKYDIVNRRLVVAHAPFADEKYARDRGYKILMRTRFFSFQNVKNGNLQFTTDKLLGDDEWQIIIPKHSNHCRDILYDPIILENIFKDKMLLYNFHPNKLTAKTLGTDVLENALFTKKNNNSKNEISCISGASFSERVKIKDGVRFHIDIYSDNVGECFLHVLHQIKHSLSFEANDTDVALMINIGYNEQLQTQLQQLLTGHFGLIPRLIDNGPTAIVLEKDDI